MSAMRAGDEPTLLTTMSYEEAHAYSLGVMKSD